MGWGIHWDLEWHIRIGRDSFWIPPHLMILAGLCATALLAFGMLFWESRRGTGDVRALGLSGSRGFHLAAWGIAITVIAAPIDALWHQLVGVDVSLWSPPHLLGFLGGAVNAAACLMIAREVYPDGGRARLAAMLLAGVVIYGSLFLMIDPSFRIAYLYSGVRYYTSVILAALLLPLAFIPTARLSGSRWAPVFAVLIFSLLGMVGHLIASVGFDRIRPVSVIDKEIAKDPTSLVSVVNIMARKNRTAPGRAAGPALLYVGLTAACGMALVDARRRPVASAVVFSLVLFVGGGLFISGTPALAPMVPGAGPTGVAMGLTLAAALLGGAASKRLSDALDA